MKPIVDTFTAILKDGADEEPLLEFTLTRDDGKPDHEFMSGAKSELNRRLTSIIDSLCPRPVVPQKHEPTVDDDKDAHSEH